MSHARRITMTAILTAMSLVAFLLEGLLPTLPLPGAKVGLGNLFSLFALCVVGWPAALVVVVVRTTLGCIILGNVGALLYSLTAGVGAMVLCIVLYRLVFPRVSILAISVAGAVLHDVIQTVVYCLVVHNWGMMAYLPYLMLFGLLGGAIVGILTWTVLTKLPASLMDTIVNHNEREKK